MVPPTRFVILLIQFPAFLSAFYLWEEICSPELAAFGRHISPSRRYSPVTHDEDKCGDAKVYFILLLGSAV
jgi:hypothetical protein